jgi:hypothetical protein
MRKNAVAFDEHAILDVTDPDLRLLMLTCPETAPVAGGWNEICATDAACLQVPAVPADVNGVCTESGYGFHLGETNLVCGTNIAQIDGGSGTSVNGACFN